MNLHECDCPDYATRSTSCCRYEVGADSFPERCSTKLATSSLTKRRDYIDDGPPRYNYEKVDIDLPPWSTKENGCALVRRVEFDFGERSEYRVSKCLPSRSCYATDKPSCEAALRSGGVTVGRFCIWTRKDQSWGELVQPGFYNWTAEAMRRPSPVLSVKEPSLYGKVGDRTPLFKLNTFYFPEEFKELYRPKSDVDLPVEPAAGGGGKPKVGTGTGR